MSYPNDVSKKHTFNNSSSKLMVAILGEKINRKLKFLICKILPIQSMTKHV